MREPVSSVDPNPTTGKRFQQNVPHHETGAEKREALEYRAGGILRSHVGRHAVKGKAHQPITDWFRVTQKKEEKRGRRYMHSRGINSSKPSLLSPWKTRRSRTLILSLRSGRGKKDSYKRRHTATRIKGGHSQKPTLS